MGAHLGTHRKRFTYGGILLAGAIALVVDRAVLAPSPAAAGVDTAEPEARAMADPGPAAAPRPRPDASVPALAERVDALDAPAATVDIFHADPDQWGLRSAGVPAQPVELRLTAIIVPPADGGAEAWALINSRARRIGDVVAGYTVQAITSGAVALQRGDEMRTLRVARKSSGGPP